MGTPADKEVASKIALELQEKNLYVFMAGSTGGVQFAEQLVAALVVGVDHQDVARHDLAGGTRDEAHESIGIGERGEAAGAVEPQQGLGGDHPLAQWDELDTEKVFLLDVREPDEYQQGAIPGALHIPRGQLESMALSFETIGDRYFA